MLELINKFYGLISLLAIFVSVIGVYWKLKIEIKGLELKICNIEIDRKEKWEMYEKTRSELVNKIEQVHPALGEIKSQLASISADLVWIKKKIK
mgnify:CR=1 FL=1